MTYRCGVYLPGLDTRPRVICDECGIVLAIRQDRPSPRWLMDNRAPPGWMLIRRETDEGVWRRDYCPRCKGGHTGE